MTTQRLLLARRWVGLAVTLILACPGRFAWACIPPCGTCYVWNGEACDWVGCNGGQGCSGCQTCIEVYGNCTCVDDNSNCRDCYVCDEGECVSLWDTAPAISDAAIKKEHDQQWFHYATETCGLRAKGHDYDTCNGVQLPDDYIDLPSTEWWIGAGVVGSGGEIVWDPPAPTGESGVEVRACIKDYEGQPDPVPSATNDADVTVTRIMYAYQAVACLNCNNQLGSSSVTVFEQGGLPEDILLSLANEWIRDYVSDGSSSSSADAYGSASWRLDTSPVTATLGSAGQLVVYISAVCGGRFTGIVGDSDIIDGVTEISVGLTGGTGFSAGVSVNIALADDRAEAGMGGGFAFSSDMLGDDTDDRLSLASADWPDNELNIMDSPFAYIGNGYFRGGKNSETKAKAVVEIATEAQAWQFYWARAEARTEGGVLYAVGVPTYETGQMQPPEDGY